jgi:hypothetical protein
MGTGAYLAIAAAIASVAFALGQVFSGMGAPFAILASTLWVAWSMRRSSFAR